MIRRPKPSLRRTARAGARRIDRATVIAELDINGFTRGRAASLRRVSRPCDFPNPIIRVYLQHRRQEMQLSGEARCEFPVPGTSLADDK